ncbi:tRNA (adenosine(37)-N6)-threonylcarbamoyltransferase complex ATPase subunit type 1 TsaE [Patescibacteria group bacterium]|nr:tRNA (adenosine(37)-N6)-threonylcarbamoyltransferase complex ATPase subunit type 1 TsaE [Patescibacteria group bacterium]MBU1015718.1 tRNA (adenosine(37)-N6)-threonylcarbamoyltransferase complex ATPase subunit type 1 TsaE [Patescibacteria group bacterium]MBU1684890.1 tRNA (adenosine(37)-N6)-threonylcarbamoyltransferase complex ATPase subunit type 1 TsaE [Patescibacteria group bacterium]MBU1938652.1 tRNA (adenosine(37)-N6)-threonylcarbamoyltransferase complex ATPase subunit type 1 TsaE [Patesc
MKTIYQTKTPEKTIELGIQLAARLKPGATVLLFGDLGSGKTQFTKGIAKGLGISELIKSPTFTYVNKYDLQTGPQTGPHFYHYDLYRLKHGEDYESIGLEETMHDDRSINVIEWADRMAGRHPATYIRVDFHSLADHHKIIFQFEDSEIVPDELVDKFWRDWVTPLHVRAHSKKVTDVCLQIGQALADKNILVNLSLLNTAGLLHDMARVCDFTELNRDKFHEEVTDDKWTKWLDLQKQFKGMNHADVACGALADDGYNKTAELVRLHNSLSILEEPEKFAYLEVAILFYADKRVKHDEIVSLAERFRDGRERHGKFDNLKTQTMFEEVEKRTFELEKQLFALISIKPEDIS